ncbi:MAG: calcium-binding protein, partial [Anaerolineales bacterium]|nr:calcium-binding protein [Anaerolineales bacterium]
DTIRMDTNGAALTLASTDFANVTTVETLALNGTGAQQVTLGAQTDAAFASGITITTQAAAVSLNLQGALSTVGITATGTNNGDTLTGGSANDSLTGGEGNDTLTGGAGIDTLLGGDGDDVFVYANVSDLTDGSIGVDDVDGGAHVNGDIISLIQTSAITIAGGMEGRLRNIEQLHVDAANAYAISISLNWDNITNTGIN